MKVMSDSILTIYGIHINRISSECPAIQDPPLKYFEEIVRMHISWIRRLVEALR